MAITLSEAARNEAANGVTITQARLHTSDPGTTGLNEVVGVPYARQAASFDVAALGQRALSANITFVLPPDIKVTHVSYWGGTVFKAAVTVDHTAIAGESTFTVTNTNTKISVV